MKFDARIETSPEKKDAFVAWLTRETVSTFERSVGDAEGLKSCVFLAVNRAHEAGITSNETARLVGISSARAHLSTEDEEVVLDWLEALDPIAKAAHADHGERKPWWKIW